MTISSFLNVDELATIFDGFNIIASRHPQNDCICVPAMPNRSYVPEGFIWSYADVRGKAAQLRGTYFDAGYGHGHRIAMMFDNRPSLVIHWLALNALGVSLVPINQDSTTYEIANLLAQSRAILAVTLPHRECLFKEAIAKLDDPIPLVLEEWPQSLPPAVRPPLLTRPDVLTETGLMFTSGTTGNPKGTMLTNESLLFNAERYIQAGGLMEITYCAERLYNPLPIYYANAFAITNIVMILSAGCMIFPDRFHPSTWWKDIVSTNATIVHYLGIIAPLLLKREYAPEETDHRVKFGLGSGVDANQHIAWEKRFRFPLMEVYGMTELGICSFASHEPRLVGQHYVGQPIGGVEYKVVDEHDQEKSAGEPGELLVRRTGPNPRSGFFSGYIDNEELTNHLWRGGWYHTGDVLLMDVDGRYYFVDRMKHMIRRSGQNISSGEVENCLRLHPSVLEVACVPVADPLRQEEVMACIILKEGAVPDEETALSIVRFALKRISYFKVPGGIYFTDYLPTTSTSKLQKDRIFAKNEHPFDRLNCYDLRYLKKKNHI